jgi:hypothetical protein
MPLSSIGKARRTFQRWLLGKEENLPTMARRNSKAQAPPPPEVEDSPAERISKFMEELRTSSQEWLGRVRMINFDSIRERVGPKWLKLQGSIEILAEKIILDEIAGRDRYLNAGNGEFLVFFADATPEESRIRCFAIIEAIHEKLFGLPEPGNSSNRKAAECQVIHRDDLALEWEAAGSSYSSPHYRPAKLLREPFRQDAEILDGADITASTQIVIDSIISRGAETRSMAELAPLLIRLQILSRSLKTLKPAVIAAEKMLSGRNDSSRAIASRTPSGIALAHRAIVFCHISDVWQRHLGRGEGRHPRCQRAAPGEHLGWQA